MHHTMHNSVMGLEDGTIVYGRSVGAEGVVCGELVFTTQFTGYEEALTDPSYKGQILMFTYPLIGNYGVSGRKFQSDGIKAEAVVVREACPSPSHYTSQLTFREWLKKEGKVCIEGVDTRELTIKLRSYGTLRACIITNSLDGEEAVKLARRHPTISELELVRDVTCPEHYVLGKGDKKIGILDLGVKRNIITNVLKRECEVHVFPADTSPDVIVESGVDALLISNGPGDPKRAKNAIRCVKEIVGQIPLYGICFGHQIISLGLGGDTYKLKFGHRGANQPVRDLEGRVLITSQNHGFAVDEFSLDGTGLEVSYVNLNDGTVEGVECRELMVKAVQFHPEASPGPHDSEAFFDKVVRCEL